jgi:hypothetical protein
MANAEKHGCVLTLAPPEFIFGIKYPVNGNFF